MKTSDNIHVEFTKIEGAGNDFILIDNRLGLYKFLLPEFTKVVCNRHFGVGADGLIVLETSQIADFKMRYFNSDGSEGGMCGNGGRCAVQYFLFSDGNKNFVQFEALNYIFKAEQIGNTIKLWMNDPTDLKQNIEFIYEKYELKLNFINTGAPHAIFFINDLPAPLLAEFNTSYVEIIGKFIRHHKYFEPKGTNVNFIDIISNQKISIRTYEKGVESETYSCGTGSVACAILSAIKYNWLSPVEVLTRSNQTLLIHFKLNNLHISDVILEGPVKIVFTGKIIYSPSLKSIT